MGPDDAQPDAEALTGPNESELRKKKKKRGKAKRQESFLPFLIKALLIVGGVFVLMVIAWIGLIWWGRAAEAPGEFSKKMLSCEETLRWGAKQWASDWAKPNQDQAGPLQRALASVGLTRDLMRKVDPPADGKAWFDAVWRMAQTLEDFYKDIDKIRTLPPDEARPQGRERATKMQEDMDRAQAEVDAAKRAFQEKHGLK